MRRRRTKRRRERDFINSVGHLIGALLDPTAKMKSEMSSNEKKKKHARRGKRSWSYSFLENNLGQNQDFMYTVDPQGPTQLPHLDTEIGQRSF